MYWGSHIYTYTLVNYNRFTIVVLILPQYIYDACHHFYSSQGTFLLGFYHLMDSTTVNKKNKKGKRHLVQIPKNSIGFCRCCGVWCLPEVFGVSEWLLFNANSAICSAISWREQVNFQWNDDEVCFVLDQHA